MKVTISNMRPGHGRAQAVFDVDIDGWVIRECVIIRHDDGRVSAMTAVIRKSIRSVDIPDPQWRQFQKASVAAFEKWSAAGRPCLVERDDAGMRRFLSAEEETLEMAGL